MNKANFRNIITDLIFDVAGSLMYAAGIYSFAKNADFAPAGVSGIALIINHYTDWPIGMMTILLNIPIILFSLKYLSKMFFIKSIKSMVIVAVFLDMVFPMLPAYNGDPLLAAIFSGALTGAGLGMIYLRDSSTGGSDFLVFTIKKIWPHRSLGEIAVVIDGIVILAGAFVFGRIDSALYGFIMMVVGTTIIDKMMIGSNVGKIAFIITNLPYEVAEAISISTERGSTVFDGKGAYSRSKRNMVMCACGKSQIVKLRRATYKVDPEAFVMITDYSETFGEGFKENVWD
ncbi:MAG: YitT family protein [Ruminococcaceae bacterium]|nr:YitT family protein [Oscillospiraceae bacterium]